MSTSVPSCCPEEVKETTLASQDRGPRPDLDGPGNLKHARQSTAMKSARPDAGGMAPMRSAVPKSANRSQHATSACSFPPAQKQPWKAKYRYNAGRRPSWGKLHASFWPGAPCVVLLGRPGRDSTTANRPRGMRWSPRCRAAVLSDAPRVGPADLLYSARHGVGNRTGRGTGGVRGRLLFSSSLRLSLRMATCARPSTAETKARAKERRLRRGRCLQRSWPVLLTNASYEESHQGHAGGGTGCSRNRQWKPGERLGLVLACNGRPPPRSKYPTAAATSELAWLHLPTSLPPSLPPRRPFPEPPR